MLKTAVIAALLLCVASNAEARQRHKVIVADPGCNVLWPCEGVAPSPRGEMIARKLGFGTAQKVYTPRAVRSAPRRARISGRAEIVDHPTGCPSRAFCGCGAAVRVFGSPIRSLWLAAAWFRFPRAEPAAGMVAVRRHHVFVLEAQLSGDLWRVYDANSGGHATRVHTRSIAGYVVVNPRGARA